MEFEELKVQIPADDSDKEEKDLPFIFVSGIKIQSINDNYYLSKYLIICFHGFCTYRKEDMKISQGVS